MVPTRLAVAVVVVVAMVVVDVVMSASAKQNISENPVHIRC